MSKTSRCTRDPFETLAIDTFSSVTAEIVGANGYSGSSRYLFFRRTPGAGADLLVQFDRRALPRRGHKSVQASNGELQLSITLDGAQEHGAFAQLAA